MDIEIIQRTPKYWDILYLAGRSCYGLESITNESIFTKLLFIRKLIENKHESVLEHCIISIFIKGCSRSFMSQITRHRHASFSVKSQHFVKHSNFKYKKLETLRPEIIQQYENLLQMIEEQYNDFVDDGVPIHVAREILPNACLTNIFMTANFREWRHIIKLRGSKDNTLEMQEFIGLVKKLFQFKIPGVFNNL